MGLGQAMQAMQDLGDLDQLEHLLQNATNPGALAEADMDRVRDLLGDDAAQQLERLSQLTKMLEEAGLIEQQGRPARAHAARPPLDRLERAARPVHQADQGARRPAPAAPRGPRPRARVPDASRTSSATRSSSTCTARSATRSRAHGRGHTGRAAPRRLRDRAHRAPHPVEHRADARPVDVDADARQLPAGQEGGDGAAPPDLVAVPPRLPRPRRLQRDRPRDHRRAAPRGLAGTSCTARTCTTGSRSPASCWPARRATSRSS